MSLQSPHLRENSKIGDLLVPNEQKLFHPKPKNNFSKQDTLSFSLNSFFRTHKKFIINST